MKIQCNGCCRAEARLLCCADEAALCWDCDDKIHGANKLASKHQRVPLTSSPHFHFPKCDICQETTGYFFCLEDRALLCRKCDVAVHTANAFVSAHQRFLLTGVKVGLESAPAAAESSCLSETTPTAAAAAATALPSYYNVQNISETSPPSISTRAAATMMDSTSQQIDPLSTKAPFGSVMPDWEFAGLADLSQASFGFVENVASTVTSGAPPLQYCRATTMTNGF